MYFREMELGQNVTFGSERGTLKRSAENLFYFPFFSLISKSEMMWAYITYNTFFMMKNNSFKERENLIFTAHYKKKNNRTYAVVQCLKNNYSIYVTDF